MTYVTYATITTCPVIRIYSSSASTWTLTSLSTSSITLTSCVVGCSTAHSFSPTFSSVTSYGTTERPMTSTSPTTSSSSLMAAPSSTPFTSSSTSSCAIVIMSSSLVQTPSSKIAVVGPRSIHHLFTWLIIWSDHKHQNWDHYGQHCYQDQPVRHQKQCDIELDCSLPDHNHASYHGNRDELYI